MQQHAPEIPVIASYSQREAINDGVLVPIFADAWDALSGGRPIMATAAIDADISRAALVEIWNAYITWEREVEPTLPIEDRMFTTTVNDKTIWVIDDGTAVTILYPEDY